MLEHLGEKLILIISIGSFSISFDVVAMIMSWVVILLLVVLSSDFYGAHRTPSSLLKPIDQLCDLGEIHCLQRHYTSLQPIFQKGSRPVLR